MEIILFALVILVNFSFPILALPLNFFCFLFFRKYRKFFAFAMAFSLACIAYVWTPAENYDLYKWHLQMRIFSNFTIADLIKHISTNYEPVNYIIKYIIAKHGNFNLVQFFVCLSGYSIILWIISDYSEIKKTKPYSVLIVSLITLLTLGYINFISGLWFNFAIINFALGIYLNYTKKTKWVHWPFYILSVLIHISTIYLLIILIISKRCKSKKYKKMIIFTFVAFIFIGPLLTLLNSKINMAIVKYIYHLYDAYFLQGDRYSSLHKGINLYEAIIKLSFFIIIIILNKKNIKKIEPKFYIFLVLVITSVIALIPSATIFIVRYTVFIEMIMIPVFIDYFSDSKDKNTILVICLLIPIIIFLTYRQLGAIKRANLNNNISQNITKNIIKYNNN